MLHMSPTKPSKTRNSASADKPRDTFGQMQWRDWPKKYAPYHMCYHAEFGRSALKDVGINTGNPQNWGTLKLRSLGKGGVADPKIHAPPQHVLPRQI